jgi:hypothetical protein
MRFNPNILGYDSAMFNNSNGLFFHYTHHVPQRASIFEEVRLHSKQANDKSGVPDHVLNSLRYSLECYTHVSMFSKIIGLAIPRRHATRDELFQQFPNINGTDKVITNSTAYGISYAFTGSGALAGNEIGSTGNRIR